MSHFMLHSVCWILVHKSSLAQEPMYCMKFCRPIFCKIADLDTDFARVQPSKVTPNSSTWLQASLGIQHIIARNQPVHSFLTVYNYTLSLWIHLLDGLKSTIFYHADWMKNQPPNPPPGGVLRPAEKGNFSKEFSAICYTSKWENFHRRVVELDAQIAGMQWRNFTRNLSHSVKRWSHEQFWPLRRGSMSRRRARVQRHSLEILQWESEARMACGRRDGILWRLDELECAHAHMHA